MSQDRMLWGSPAFAKRSLIVIVAYSLFQISASEASPTKMAPTSPRRIRGDELRALLTSAYFEAVRVPPPGEDAGAEAFYTRDRMTKFISMGVAGSLFKGSFTIDGDRYCASIAERRYDRCTMVYSLGRDLFRFDNVHSDGRRTSYVVHKTLLKRGRNP